MEVPLKADVVVLGGGPAGSLCAGLLAKRGFDVVLLEKSKHPRRTVGESILPHFWRYADMLGATERMEAEGFVVKAGTLVLWGDVARGTRFRDFGHTQSALHADRDIFDKILLDAAGDCGAKIFECHMAIEVDLDGEEKKVTYRVLDPATGSPVETREITSSFVVDATGQVALVAKQFGFREFDTDLKFSSIWGYFDGGRYFDFEHKKSPFSERFDRSPVTFLESRGGWGWSWHITMKSSTSVGFVLPRDQLLEFKQRAGTMESKFLDMVREMPVLGSLMEDATYNGERLNAIRDYAYKPNHLALNGCYLVGDAAAFVDPINSSGVTFALYAATLAAWSIEASLNKRTRSEYYQAAYERQYRQRLEIFRLVALPAEVELTEAELRAVCDGFGFFSDAEKQLALTTTMLTCRPEKVIDVFNRLNVEPQAIYTDVPLDKLVSMEMENVFSV